jgi:hypothetical protein
LNKQKKSLHGSESGEELLSSADVSEAGSRATTSSKTEKTEKSLKNVVADTYKKLASGSYGTLADSIKNPEHDFHIKDFEYPVGSGKFIRVRVNSENPEWKQRAVLHESLRNYMFDKKEEAEKLGLEVRKMSDELHRINKKADEASTVIHDNDKLTRLLMSDDTKWDKELEALWSRGGIFILVHYKVPQIYFLETPIIDGETLTSEEWLKAYMTARRDMIVRKVSEVVCKAGRRAAESVRGKAKKTAARQEAALRVAGEFDRADYYDLPPFSSVDQPRTARAGLLSGFASK